MRVYIGIDWSEQKHNICFMNEAGGAIVEIEIKHKAEGFLALDEMRAKLGVRREDSLVGIETSHNLLVDYLVEKGYVVYVLAPAKVKGSQSRRGVAGAKDDRKDARLIADIVRTDHAQMGTWEPQGKLVQQMRAKVSLITFLTHSCVRYSNRLRAVLLRYYPAALKIFSSTHTKIALAFIRAYSDPDLAAKLTLEEFKAFLKQNHSMRSNWVSTYFTRLKSPMPASSAHLTATYQSEAVLLAGLLADSLAEKDREIKELTKLYEQHPDAYIFKSLPAAGLFLEPALLAKLGDHRSQFPTAAVLQAIAGSSPITRQSGKHRSVQFRKACDRELRFISQQWAKASVRSCDWAKTYYLAVYRRSHSKNGAYRCLANRWLAILWKLWQSGQTYDETFLLQQRALRTLPHP